VRGVGNPLMVVEIAMRRASASRVGRCSSRIMRVCRSTSVPIAEGWFLHRLGEPRTTPARPLVSAAMTSARADNEVAFPVAWLAAVGGIEWPLMDRQHVLDRTLVALWLIARQRLARSP
jgi:hypothetical protein